MPCSLVHLLAANVVYSSILKTAVERCFVMLASFYQKHGIILQNTANTLQPVYAQP
jgi:hypothetical protein